ncbi:MAG: PqqD family protein [Gemmatimonadaceae bacterium]|nr:PqqD family protein [Gemmatimonadaceae bacterium]
MLPSPLPSVVFQRIDDGAVLFSPATEIYFGLNEVGAKVWQLLPPTTSSLEELCEAIGRDYPDVEESILRQDISELLAELQTEGLVAPADGAPAADGQNAR